MRQRISDVARKAGVSIATVSRVLNESGYSSDEVKEKVRSAVKELNYKKKKSTKVVNKHNKKIIGIIVADINNPFFGEIIKGVNQVAKDKGYSAVIYDTDEKIDNELKALEVFESQRVSGIIISPVSEEAPNNNVLLENLQKSGIQVVLIDRDVKVSNFDGVFIDNFKGAFDGVEALINSGHRRIGTIAGPVTSKPGKDRLEGYFEALRQYKISVNEDFICYGDFKWESGYTLTKKMMTKQNKPTAIFVSNNMMSLGCLKALKELEIVVPEDVALLVFDDYVALDTYRDNISVIGRSAIHMGIEAAKILLERIENKQNKDARALKRIIILPKLILRGSEILVNSKKLTEEVEL